MRVGGPPQWCGPNRVVVGHRVARQGDDWRGVPSDATSGGRGVDITERRTIQGMLVIGFAILLMR